MENAIDLITPNVESSTRIESENLDSIFGKNGEYFERKEGGYSVKLILADGISPGGQKVEINIGDKEEIRNYEGFKCTRFVINDLDYTEVFPNIIFEIRNERPSYFRAALSAAELNERMNAEENPVKRNVLKRTGTRFEPETKSLVVMLLENADDLVTLFHEKGHLDSPEDQSRVLVNYIGKMNMLMAITNELQGQTAEKYQGEYFDCLDHVLAGEAQANQNALKVIRKDGDRLFPSDPDLYRVTKALATNTMTYIHFGEKYFPSTKYKSYNLVPDSVD